MAFDDDTPDELWIAGQDWLACAEGVAEFALAGAVLVSLDGPTSLAFAELGCASNVPRFVDGTEVAYKLDGTAMFAGKIAGCTPSLGRLGWTHAYRAYGPEWWADRISVTNPQDSTGRIAWNLPSTDPDFDSSLVGSVGDILAYLYTAHSADLAAAGITGHDDFSVLDVVPVTAVTFSGLGLFRQMRDLVALYQGDHALAVDAAGVIRVKAYADFPATTIDLAQDGRAARPELSRDASDCFTAVVVRGQPRIKGFYASLSDGTLSKAWLAADETAWKYDQFAGAADAVNKGNVTGTGSTILTCTNTTAGASFGANFWADRKARIYLKRAVAGGVTVYDDRRVIANSALSGGTFTVTVDYPLDLNWGAPTAPDPLDEYTLVGNSGGKLDVYRLYNVVPEPIRSHLVTFTSNAIAVASTTGTLALLINIPQAWTVQGVTETPMAIDVLAASGQIRTRLPVVYPYNTVDRLKTGNPGLTVPDDVRAMLLWADGVLSARSPATGWAGTGYDEEGIEATYYVDVDTWDYPGDTPQMTRMAEMILETVKDVVREGTWAYEGLHAGLLDPTQVFHAVQFAATDPGGWTTGLESVPIPCRSLSVTWEDDAGGYPRKTAAAVSTRKKFATAAAQFGAGTLNRVGDPYGRGYHWSFSPLFGPDGTLDPDRVEWHGHAPPEGGYEADAFAGEGGGEGDPFGPSQLDEMPGGLGDDRVAGTRRRAGRGRSEREALARRFRAARTGQGFGEAVAGMFDGAGPAEGLGEADDDGPGPADAVADAPMPDVTHPPGIDDWGPPDDEAAGGG